MIGSFILSRTLVPTMASYLLVAHGDARDASVARSHDAGQGHHPRNIRWCVSSTALKSGLRRCAPPMTAIWNSLDGPPACSRAGFLALRGTVPWAGPVSGREFLSRRGCRHDLAACARAHGDADGRNRGAVRPCREAHPRRDPARDLGSIVDNIGLPVSGTNRAYLNTGGVGPEDGDILITLKKGIAPPPAM